MLVKLRLDTEAACRLVESGVREFRPAGLQAEVLLRRALGLPEIRDAPTQPPTAQPESAAPAEVGHDRAG